MPLIPALVFSFVIDKLKNNMEKDMENLIEFAHVNFSKKYFVDSNSFRLETWGSLKTQVLQEKSRKEAHPGILVSHY